MLFLVGVMQTTLTVILPVTLEGDPTPDTDTVGGVSTGAKSTHAEHVATPILNGDKLINNCNNECLDMVDTSGSTSSRRNCFVRKTFQEKFRHFCCGSDSGDNSPRWNPELAYGNKQLLQQLQRFRHEARKQQEKKAQIPQQQHQQQQQQQQHHQMSSDGQLSDSHRVVLDKGAVKSPVSSARITEPPPNYWPQRPLTVGEVHLSLSDAYDIDMGHHDIMVKALRSYSQYCECDGDADANADWVNNSLKENRLVDTCGYEDQSYHIADQLQNGQQVSYITYAEYESTRRPVHSSRPVKMAQCRLRFYDDDDSKDTKCSMPERPPLLYALEDGNGVLADAVGHVSRSTKTQTWSALPARLCDLIKVDRRGQGFGEDRRYQDLISTNIATDKQNRLPNRLNLNSRSQSAVSFLSRAKMAQPIPHSSAFQRRNQTTHMWTDSSQLMSQSVPGAGFLHRNFRTSPRSSDAGSEKGSPAGKSTRTRPSSSYSYDGGFFVGAHSGQAEYFVIHPDWVSESVTVKKLSLGDKTSDSPFKRSLSVKSRSLPDGRRCLSAPPKQRNPITMDHSESAAKSK